MLFIEYPKCSTCEKAKKYLDENKIKYEDRDIVVNNPNEKELTKWIGDSNIDIHKFFNTSGMLYRQMELSKKLDGMSKKEMINILASNGMLIKRPLIVKDNKEVILGFKENEYAKLK